MTISFIAVRDLFRYAVTRFSKAKLVFGHGLTNAYDEAAYLVLHTLNLPIDTLEPFLDARLLPEEIAAVLTVIEHRTTNRIPAAYITHEAYMHGYSFYVDNRVIIPRSFIGELLINAKKLQPYLVNFDKINSVLELCTGSGCLAILATHVFPNAIVDAVDLSEQAIEVARINVHSYGLEDRVTLYIGDLYEPLPIHRSTKLNERYSIIITNPPYIKTASMTILPPEYRHEPEIALAGGIDGMDVARRIIEDARRWLKDDGVLIVEIGNNRESAEQYFGDLNLIWLPTSGGKNNVFLIHALDLPKKLSK
ncbi:MAG: 50S ribosomal protein L3 N(5)-glutamine methyltransferase [Burkholderia sp.]|nr:50S ribosomal protein L3 N(5)-glutamine methyltransferase [Burkholderia sp.]